jgi:hypothetical protein
VPEDQVQRQTALPLPFPELAGDMPLLPARMLNEYQYCPRLAYLEWVQGEWADSADTVEGRGVHRRVDRPSGELPPPEDVDADTRIHARSITLSSNRLGLMFRKGPTTAASLKRDTYRHRGASSCRFRGFFAAASLKDASAGDRRSSEPRGGRSARAADRARRRAHEAAAQPPLDPEISYRPRPRPGLR